MSDLRKILKDLRKKNKLTQQAVADKIGVTDVTIGRYERGDRIPNLVTIQKLSDLYKEPILELLSEDDREIIINNNHNNSINTAINSMLNNLVDEYLKNCNNLFMKKIDSSKSNSQNDDIECFDVDLSKLPKLSIVGTVRAGVGGAAIEDEIGTEYAYIDNASKETHFYLKVKGDSMEPKISEGDLALVKRQSDVDSGNLAIVLVNGEEGVLKKVIKEPNLIKLVSFNPYYPDRKFEGKEMEKIKILGKVIKIISSW